VRLKSMLRSQSTSCATENGYWRCTLCSSVLQWANSSSPLDRMKLKCHIRQCWRPVSAVRRTAGGGGRCSSAAPARTAGGRTRARCPCRPTGHTGHGAARTV
jgi:hypothetical protein